MRKPHLWLIPLLLACMTALSACATNPTQPVLVPCPKLPPVPASLMQPPLPPLHSASQIRSLLFESVTPATSETDSKARR